MHKPDKTLLTSALALILFGLLMVASASSVVSQDRFGHPYAYLVRQLVFGLGGGAIGFFVGYMTPYRKWQTLAPFLLLAALVLMLLVFLPQTGFGYGGAKRWVQAGPLSFQPAELLKLALIFYLAAWFAKRKKEIRSVLEGSLPFLVVLGVVGALLALQPDIGTLGVVILTGGAMYFVAGGRITHITAIGAFVLSSIAGLIWLAPYRIARLLTFLDPSLDPQGIGYQLRQSLIAIGSGGLLGLGLGYSRQKYYYVPEPFGDSIFAIMAEEIGFIGVILFLAALGLFLGLGLRAAFRATDEFGRFTAVGIVSWLGFQSLINIGAVSGLVPFTGIPLPFVSYGGTSLTLVLTAVGVLANISRHRISH